MVFLNVLPFVLLITISQAQFFNFNLCSSILKEDCYTYGNSPECGTNGVTYRNRCDFSKAHCENKNIHVQYYSKCSNDTTTVNPNPGVTTVPNVPGSTTAPILSGIEAVLDFFCINLAFKPCDKINNPVCGNNTVTYENPCEFEKARCTHRELHLLHYGNCSGDPFNP